MAEDVLQESLLELCDLAGLHLVQVTSDTSVDDCYLLLNSHGSWSGERPFICILGHTILQRIFILEDAETHSTVPASAVQ